MTLGVVRASVVDVGKGLQGDAELGHEGLHQEGVGGDMKWLYSSGHTETRAIVTLERCVR